MALCAAVLISSLLILGLLLSISVVGATDPKYAFATIYYPGGKLSLSDFIGIRTMYKSFQKMNSVADFVVLVTEDTSEHEKKQLREDGMIVKSMNIVNAYKQRKVHADYQKMMNIITLWSLTEYKRVIFVDYYTIFHENFDSLFNCSYLCLKDEQPLVRAALSVFRRSTRTT